MQSKVCPQCNETKGLTEFNPHFFKKTGRTYYSWCFKCTSRKSKEQYHKHHEKRLSRAREVRERNPEGTRLYLRECRLRLRMGVLNAYSGNTPMCACCGEKEIKFLCVDHIDGGGHQHNIELNKRGQGFYQWLKNNRYPSGFQVLCHNCNMAKGFYGKCPHKTTR